ESKNNLLNIITMYLIFYFNISYRCCFLKKIFLSLEEGIIFFKCSIRSSSIPSSPSLTFLISLFY
ncbi:MAG: hypothetical protein ACXWE0_04885, partial [Nitrososphaeraceae archaeon]